MARGLIALGQGDAGTAIPTLEGAADLCSDGHYEQYLTLAAALLGSAYVLAGRVDEGLTSLREAARRALPYQQRCWVWLGDTCLRAGRADEARRLAEGTLATARRIGERGTEAHALWLLGEIAARSGPAAVGEAERHYLAALALATELGMRPSSPGATSGSAGSPGAAARGRAPRITSPRRWRYTARCTESVPSV